MNPTTAIGTRDDFPQKTKRALAQRVGDLCSNPDCRAHTTGPQSDPVKSINVGVAAHITAAPIGGPRFDPLLAHAERRGAANGIWLCQTCAKLIDTDPDLYCPDKLRQWKANAEQEARSNIGEDESQAAIGSLSCFTIEAGP